MKIKFGIRTFFRPDETEKANYMEINGKKSCSGNPCGHAASCKGGFKFFIDRGGTFTDIYAEVPGEPGFRVLKLLSESPLEYADAPLEGIRRIMEDVLGEKVRSREIPSAMIREIRMGTTIATNALLEGKGARCALLITRGFRDLLEIRSQDRPDIFALEIKKPAPLYEEVVEVGERLRILRDGERIPCIRTVLGTTGEKIAVMESPDPAKLEASLERLLEKGIRSLAVVLMHSHAWSGHEDIVAESARKMGFERISLSSRVTGCAKIIPRGETALVDAYLGPGIRDWLNRFKKGFSDGLQKSRPLFMKSDGGLATEDGFTGSGSILSGPAAGVVGYASTAYDENDAPQVIGFDMGGTSTDASRFAGGYERVLETETAGVRIHTPQLHIKTVAAGGGSRLFFENGMLLTGPESSGADPGPVCYGKGGPLSLTDANLVLGRLLPHRFPSIFGENGKKPLDRKASVEAMTRLTAEINAYSAKTGRRALTPEEAALGFVRVANEVMARPVKEISVQRGFDIKDHTLAVFGGAGPQHACAIAKALGISRILIHRFAGALSAYGIGLADVVAEKRKPCGRFYGEIDFSGEADDLQKAAVAELISKGFEPERITASKFLNLRFQGTDTAVEVEEPGDGDFAKALGEIWRREFGFEPDHRAIVVDEIMVVAKAGALERKKFILEGAQGPPQRLETVSCGFEKGRMDTNVFDLKHLKAGHAISGPAVILHDTSTIIVEPGCVARVTDLGDVEITVSGESGDEVHDKVDPVRLSIFANLFISVAEQMGGMLRKMAVSTNIKERLDFSCALFDPEGNLVANAPHLPVHLGSMSEAVKAQIRMRGRDIRPKDAFVSNHPCEGGTHLPDITVTAPVFKNGSIIFWTACRGHHADIGGISPGSMPADSQFLSEEGACISSFKLVENGVFMERGIAEILLAPAKATPAEGRPAQSGARRLSDNISDLKAQVAANRKGVEAVLEIVERHGLSTVTSYMRHVQDASEEAVRDRLREISPQKDPGEPDVMEAEDMMDDESPIRLKISIDRKRGSAVFDFSGTAPQSKGNLNAPPAVTKSAVLYCLRCLIKKDLPLNDGALRPVEIKIPEGSLLDPSPDAAVSAGNVLTSQRLVDVIFKAFGSVAASQGCTNNFTFGDDTFGYYETIGGGAGAGPSWNGASGVHTHMTNTRITDPEILERRYPVLLREFSIRRGSGGEGEYSGGDGLVREIEFLKPLDAAILSERRVCAPYGLAGGEPGATGENVLIKKDGAKIDLGGKRKIKAAAGDRMRISTPGGGGWGRS